MAHSIKREIILTASAALALLFFAVWLSIGSVSERMNGEARQTSESLMKSRISTHVTALSVIASDYHNWTDLYSAAMRTDIEDLSSNYGISAHRGDVFQYAVIYSGPLNFPMSWTAGQGLEPQPSFLPDELLDLVGKRVLKLDFASRETFDFFYTIGGDLVMVSASMLLPEDPAMVGAVNLQNPPISIIGRILSDQVLDAIAGELSVSNLHYTSNLELSNKLSFLALIGPKGEPEAFLKWSPKRPGEQLIREMTPIFIGIALAKILAAILAVRAILISAQRLIDQKATAQRIARTDFLTEIPNRFALLERLSQINCGNSEIVVLYVDLDNFKQINDIAGHSGGDLFLKEFSARLSGLCDEFTFVARAGGDEFVVVYEFAHYTTVQMKNVLKKFSMIAVEPIICKGHLFDVRASKGVAQCRSGSLEVSELLRRADCAMYKAKIERSQDIAIYDDSMERSDRAEANVARALSKAIREGGAQFSMHYQPVVLQAGSGRIGISYLEALARWTSPEYGCVPPSQFIRIAENGGSISSLGWLIVERVLEDLAMFPSLRVSINVSPLQLMMLNFAEDFFALANFRGIDCGRIEVEVTENVALRNADVIDQNLRALKSYGFRLAIDDFGVGFASLSYLHRLPFDTVKIDRSLVVEIGHSKERRQVISSIVSIAHVFGMRVVAEGVESYEDLKVLRDVGCDLAQGHYFGRPRELTEWQGAHLPMPGLGEIYFPEEALMM